MILTLALRNLARHAGQSALLLGMFTVVTAVFVLGNSAVLGTQRALGVLFTGTVTGDLVVRPADDVHSSVYGVTTPAIGGLMSLPLIGRTDKVETALAETPAVESWARLVTGRAAMDVHGRRYDAVTFGIVPSEYFALFPGLIPTQGRLLGDGERGILLTRGWLDRIEAETGARVVPGDEVLLTAASRYGFRIRGVPLVGVFSYPVALDLLDQTVIIDAVTARELNAIMIPLEDGYSATAETSRTPADLDDLFLADQEVQADPGSALTVGDVIARLGGQEADEVAPSIDGAVHFLLLRVSPTHRHRAARVAIETALGGFDVEVVDWQTAAGNAALLSVLLVYVFNAGFVVFACAVAVASVNVWLISTVRRRRELGTIRALGAQRGFVAAVLHVEAAVLALASSSLGIVAAATAARAISAACITFDNPLLQALFSGSTLRLTVDPAIAIAALPAALVLTAVATAYPVRSVLATPVVRAIGRG